VSNDLRWKLLVSQILAALVVGVVLYVYLCVTKKAGRRIHLFPQ
jgi:hypothetical protein